MKVPASKPSVDRLLLEADRLLDVGRPAVARLLLQALGGLVCDPHVYAVRLARTHLALGDAQAAIQVLNAAACVGVSALPLLWRARARLAVNDAEGALRDAAWAAELSPADPEAVGLFATLAIEHGEPAAAACALETAIQFGAAQVALHIALAVALLSQDDRPAARAAILRGLLQHPASASLHRLLRSALDGAPAAQCLIAEVQPA